MLSMKKNILCPGIDNTHSIKWNKKVNLCAAGAKTSLSFPSCRSGWPHTTLLQCKPYAVDYMADEQWAVAMKRRQREYTVNPFVCVC